MRTRLFVANGTGLPDETIGEERLRVHRAGREEDVEREPLPRLLRELVRAAERRRARLASILGSTSASEAAASTVAGPSAPRDEAV